MDHLSAFAMGMASQGKPMMVFDWDKAAQLIKESGCSYADAGLSGDWEYTGGPIYRDGEIIPKDETYVYLASTWATPELRIDGETVDCWKWQSDSPDWDAHTYWPESAVNILNKKEEKENAENV